MSKTDFAASLAAAKANGPTGDQRSSTVPSLAGHGTGLPGWAAFMPVDERELADAWRGRQRTMTVQQMVNDSQVTALRQAVRLPVHRYLITLDPMDADPVAADLLASDLDVPLVGEDERRPGRRANRFSGRRHLDRALDALDYGHAVFEQAGRLDDAGYWRLTDLAPVPQWTIDDQASWEIDRHGRLLKVIQLGTSPPVEIPTDHLVVFTWQGAPGDPRGRPILRSLYGSWLMRDRTMRVMGMSAERTGMGIPVGSIPQGAVVGAKEKMEGLLAGLAAGHDTDLVLETDDVRKSVMLMGVTGSTPDLVGMLNYHDESMARAMLAMLIQLGQTQTGSRALGGTFDDLLSDFHDTVVDWYCDTMQQQLVEPWIDRNRGEDAPAPRLVWQRRADVAAAEAVPAAEATVIDSTATEIGGSGPAVGLQAAGREQEAARPKVATRQTSLARRQRAARTSFATTTGRELRRDPTEAELAAATDFAQLEQQFVVVHADLAAVLDRDRGELIDTAGSIVEAMATVDPLTLASVLGPQLEAHAAAMDTGPIVTLLTGTAAQGVSQVVGEAARQGVSITAAVDYAARAETEARELLRRIAGQVTEEAATAARTSVQGEPVQARRGLLGKLRPARFATVEADWIKGKLTDLTVAFLEQIATGAAGRAVNNGRFTAIASAPTKTILSSELLDQATCLAPDALVTTADGEKPAASITLSDRLLTHAGRFVHPSAITRSEAKGELLRIAVGGRTLRATPNHEVLVCRGEDFAWREASELLVGDFMLSEASAKPLAETGGGDVGLRDAPDGEAARLNVRGLAAVDVGAQRVPVGAVSLDDDRAEQEVDDPWSDLRLRGVPNPFGFEDEAHATLDAGLRGRGHVAAPRAVPLARLGRRDDSNRLAAVLAVDEDRWAAADLAAVSTTAGLTVAKGSTAPLACGIAATVFQRTGTRTVVVARRVRDGNREVHSTANARLRHAVERAAGVARRVLRAAGVGAVDGPPPHLPSDLGAALFACRGGAPGDAMRNPSTCRAGVAPLARLADRLAAVHTRPVHKDILLERVDGIGREMYSGTVYDFTIPEDHTFFAERVLVHNCDPCAEVDGDEYDSMEEATNDYPGGGYVGCKGMERCRGTLIAIFETEQEASA